jgi:transmembrane sensor
VVSLAPSAPPPQAATLSAAELEQKTAWQPRLLDFTAASLGEIVGEFNRRNPVHLILGDTDLGALRLSATFHSDNVEGFVRLMESDFGMRAEWRGETEIVLRKAR